MTRVKISVFLTLKGKLFLFFSWTHTHCTIYRLVNGKFFQKYGKQQACEAIKMEVGDNWQDYMWPRALDAVAETARTSNNEGGPTPAGAQPSIQQNVYGDNNKVQGGGNFYGPTTFNM